MVLKDHLLVELPRKRIVCSDHVIVVLRVVQALLQANNELLVREVEAGRSSSAILHQGFAAYKSKSTSTEASTSVDGFQCHLSGVLEVVDGGSQNDSKETALRMYGVVLADAFLGKNSSDSRNHICSVHPVVVRDILVPADHQGMQPGELQVRIIRRKESLSISWAPQRIIPLLH